MAGNCYGEQNPAYGSLQPHFTLIRRYPGYILNGTCADRRVLFHSELMTEKTKTDWPDWTILLERFKEEVALLSKVESCWLKDRLAVIEVTQLAMDELFRKVGGIESCAECDGTCCGCGRHHITLTNLLAYLLQSEEPPAPDFNCTCPYLGEQGCRLSVARRPYTCITFFCETLDDRLSLVDREQLRTLDSQLRNEYQRVAERYPVASQRGLWIALGRIGSGQLLYSPEYVME